MLDVVFYVRFCGNYLGYFSAKRGCQFCKHLMITVDISDQ